MTLPAGQISLSQVNGELGRASTASLSLGDAAVRSLAGVPAGQIGLSNLQGKTLPAPGPGPAPAPSPTVLTYSLTSGYMEVANGDGGSINVYTGFYPSFGIGAMTPTTFTGGTNIVHLYSRSSATWPNYSSFDYIELYITGLHAQGEFTEIDIGGTKLHPADATYNNPSGNSTWLWAITYKFTTGVPITVTITLA